MNHFTVPIAFLGVSNAPGPCDGGPGGAPLYSFFACREGALMRWPGQRIGSIFIQVANFLRSETRLIDLKVGAHQGGSRCRH
jgi:hypothetical protein